MVSAAVLGAAAGTGLALVVAVTIVVYRYYSLKHYEKYWSTLDRWPDPPTDPAKGSLMETNRTQHYCHTARTSHVLDCWRKPQRNYCAVQSQTSTVVLDALVKVPDKLSEVFGDVLELACGSAGGSDKTTGTSTASRIGMVTGVAIIRDRWVQRSSRSPLSSVNTNDSADSNTSTTSSEEFNIAKEQHAVQPTSTSGAADGGLPHQSRSYPCSGAPVQGPGGRVLVRNPSISSQGSLEGASGPSVHRGSSPQIRAFGPDGRHHYHEPVHAASSYPPNRTSRSPSPARAASLDARCGSPASYTGSIQSGTASPSQSSLSSLATVASTSAVSSTMGAHKSGSRCLSPLLIPPPRACISDGGPAPPASPLGSLQPDLYQRRDGPLFLSARRSDHTSSKSLGRLHLRLKYDFDRSDLHVHLIEAHDLAGTDQGGFNDPFVKLTLSPEVDLKKRQTPIHRSEANPLFDQHFKFPVGHDELQEKTLVLQVFDYDRYSRNDVVGSVRIAMEELELDSSSSSIEIWGEIAGEKKPPEEIQEVLLSLSYLPSAERLTVLILKARNLFPSQEKETLDPFVKVSLLSGDRRVKKKKTEVKKSTNCPVWNEAMSFNIPASALSSSAIEICVLDASSELIGGNAIVGSCIIGPAIEANASGGNYEMDNPSREHWTKITQSPRKGIAMWHTLH